MISHPAFKTVRKFAHIAVDEKDLDGNFTACALEVDVGDFPSIFDQPFHASFTLPVATCLQ